MLFYKRIPDSEIEPDPYKENREEIVCVNKVINEYIHNMYKNPTVEEISKHTRISINNIHSLFKKYLDATPSQYLEKLRVQHAKDLMTGTNLSLEEIVEFSGFSSASVLSRSFSKHENMPPNLYRKMSQHNDSSNT